jgi:hypothetical protein
MADSHGELRRLLAVAELAYQHARLAVFDQLRPEELTDVSQLSDYQRESLDMLADAENALREYRERSYQIVLSDHVARVPEQWAR